jgi:hypothetical protein
MLFVHNIYVLHKWNSYEDICISITVVIFKLLDFVLSIKTHFGIPNPRYMDKDKSSETDYSSNMLGFLANKEERVLVHLIATKFHTNSVIDSRLEVRLNPIIKDLVINMPVAKKKRIKRHKKEEYTV